MTRVRFSKYLYAMLTHESFTPPQHPTFRLPARSSSQFKAHELGVKLVSIRHCEPVTYPPPSASVVCMLSAECSGPSQCCHLLNDVLMGAVYVM